MGICLPKTAWPSTCQAAAPALAHDVRRYRKRAQPAQRGQLATQYVDLEGEPTMELRYNPNGSVLAVEAVCSPDGRVLGKMGHTERSGAGLYQNVPGAGLQPVFESGVDYFR